VENARVMGDYLTSRLEGLSSHRWAGRVSGIGLLRALFLKADPALHVGGFIRTYCWQHGMILRNNGDILVFAPALIITREQVDEVIRILDDALSAAERALGR
jgi:adenosylmethionine-8-amino-7-oxononanoate aminotransferase